MSDVAWNKRCLCEWKEMLFILWHCTWKESKLKFPMESRCLFVSDKSLISFKCLKFIWTLLKHYKSAIRRLGIVCLMYFRIGLCRPCLPWYLTCVIHQSIDYIQIICFFFITSKPLFIGPITNSNLPLYLSFKTECSGFSYQCWVT